MIISAIRNIIRQTITSMPKLQARRGQISLLDDTTNDLIDDEGNKLISLIFGGGDAPGPPPGGLWTPAELADLNGWYDAADTDTLTIIADQIDVWDDKSGDGNHIVASDPSFRIDYGTRQLNSIDIASNEFSSTVQMDVTNSPSVVQVCGVFTPTNNTTSGLCYASGNAVISQGGTILAAPYNLVIFNKQGRYTIDGGTLSGFDTDHSETLNINDFRVFTGEYNGALITSRALSQPNSPSASNGDFAEIIHTSAALSESDRQKVEGYLAWKWGLEANLPVGHPYELAAPTI